MEWMKHPLTGRRKIFTDEKTITKENIVDVLYKAYAIHRANAAEMQYLYDYESGVQPLIFQKKVRPDVDLKINDNMANYITEFNKGYFWANTPVFIQRGNKEHHKTDEDTDSEGISALNEMMLNGICIGKQNQILSTFLEKGSICLRYVNYKKQWSEDDKYGRYVDYFTLDPRFSFCVYYAGIGQKKVMGVTFSKVSGKLYFTCYTEDRRYEISGRNVDYSEPNRMRKIPIVEHIRSIDLTGCFERQIPMMDYLNALISCSGNDAVQRTQELWWSNDVEFPKDETTGKTKTPENGGWVQTFTGGEGNNPNIKPLSSTFDGTSAQATIEATRNEILKKCFVPMQYDSSGGGSTGVAADTMSGWNATEVAAMAKEQLEQGAMREELELILKAIEFVPTDILPADDPMRKLHITDIDIKFNRNRNWDLSTKINFIKTGFSCGLAPQHVIPAADLFPDAQQVIIDSKEGIAEYQKSVYGQQNSQQSQDERIMQDSGDQSGNSPAIDGLQTDNAPSIR